MTRLTQVQHASRSAHDSCGSDTFSVTDLCKAMCNPWSMEQFIHLQQMPVERHHLPMKIWNREQDSDLRCLK